MVSRFRQDPPRVLLASGQSPILRTSSDITRVLQRKETRLSQHKYQFCLLKADLDNHINGCHNTHTESTSLHTQAQESISSTNPNNPVINRTAQHASRVIRIPSLLTARCRWVSTGAPESVAASWAQMRHDDAFVVRGSAEESVEALPEGETGGRCRSRGRVRFTL